MYNRIVQQGMRRLLMMIGGFMLLLFTVRLVKYHLLYGQITMIRYMNYAYQIPVAAIPLLSLWTAERLGEGEEKQWRGKRLWLAVPCLLLMLCFMTNDLHKWVYMVGEDGGTYGYGAVYYLSYAWQILLLAGSFWIMVKKCRKLHGYRLAVIPFGFLAVGLLFFILHFLNGSIRI